MRGVTGGRMASDAGDEGQSPTFGESVHSRLVGSRFQEVNRDSVAYGRLPVGSRVGVDRMGGLGPIQSDLPVDASMFGPNHGLDPSSGNDADAEMSPASGSIYPETSRGASADDEQPTSPAYPGSFAEGTSNFRESPFRTSLTPQPSTSKAVEDSVAGSGGIARARNIAPHPPERRETFAMRTNGSQIQEDPEIPLHLRLQPQGPFVRPLSGLDHDNLGAVYSDIREWRTQLKSINKEIADVQNDCYNDIADGARIKGWLITGRGVRFLPGIKMIEGRSKSDIVWDELQLDKGMMNKIMFWTFCVMVALFLGAGRKSSFFSFTRAIN